MNQRAEAGLAGCRLCCRKQLITISGSGHYRILHGWVAPCFRRLVCRFAMVRFFCCLVFWFWFWFCAAAECFGAARWQTQPRRSHCRPPDKSTELRRWRIVHRAQLPACQVGCRRYAVTDDGDQPDRYVAVVGLPGSSRACRQGRKVSPRTFYPPIPGNVKVPVQRVTESFLCCFAY